MATRDARGGARGGTRGAARTVKAAEAGKAHRRTMGCASVAPSSTLSAEDSKISKKKKADWLWGPDIDSSEL